MSETNIIEIGIASSSSEEEDLLILKVNDSEAPLTKDEAMEVIHEMLLVCHEISGTPVPSYLVDYPTKDTSVLN